MSISTYARRLVSGGKARFKDEKLNIELDLAYLTDRIIMMGYPASGVAAMYRNKAEDAKTFLESRHKDKYWVFNMCPLKENSYPASLFNGRVSRYPFPDHHAPPLAILALASREIGVWLDGDPERVVVLHCKAGKGRTGTIGCAYLLACGEAPSPPKLERSYSPDTWAKMRAEKLIRAVDSESESDGSAKVDNRVDVGINPSQSPISNQSQVQTGSQDAHDSNKHDRSLESILHLHTNRRMKPAENQRRGVSIPSQRRFLYYWSLLLLSPEQVPNHIWSLPTTTIQEQRRRPKVWLRQIRVRLREPSSVKRGAIRAINSALDSLGKGRERDSGKGEVWVSLARYDDDLVELLERWEKWTRSDNNLGERKRDVPRVTGEGESARNMDQEWETALRNIFADGTWDNKKMVRSFARLGASGSNPVTKVDEKHDRLEVHTLLPFPPSEWVHVDNVAENPQVEGEDDSDSEVDEAGAEDTEIEEGGILLDAAREVRAKLYMGQVPMGWFWFIPSFHMPQPPPPESPPLVSRFALTRKEVDFPLGPGSWLIDVEIVMAWATVEDEHLEPRQPPKESSGDDAGKIVAGALAEGTVVGIPEAIQAERQ